MLQKNAVAPGTLALLKKLCSLDFLGQFALGGGTNVALRLGHRVSTDLDFFTNTSFDTAGLFQKITKTFPSAELLFEQNQTMFFFIDDIKVDFVLYPFPWLRPFEFTEDCRLLTMEDIIPLKLQAAGNRQSKKDFWDIVFLLEHFSLTEMLDIFHQKFPQVDPGYIIHHLTGFDEADKQFDPDILIPRTWTEIKSTLITKVTDFTKSSL